ncbi:MAG: thioredoxin-dependent thiol peroxidase [Dehalococcoidia bacterium]
MAVTLEAGDAAPPFLLPDQDGKMHGLSDYAGRIVALYFYPKDMTPGCTTQACSLRDAEAELEAMGIAVLGVSTDSAESHRRFRTAHALRFPLLVDQGAKVAERYGAWGEKTLYGRTSVGMIRSTFLIGPDGRLLKVWKRARAAAHGEAVLAAMRDINKKTAKKT